MEHRENMVHPEALSTFEQGALRDQGVLSFHKRAPAGGGIH
jgi:hypothetical protein